MDSFTLLYASSVFLRNTKWVADRQSPPTTAVVVVVARAAENNRDTLQGGTNQITVFVFFWDSFVGWMLCVCRLYQE